MLLSDKKVGILQSNYIPWKGYFDIIAAVDVFVVFDDMQYTKRDWRNRNRIKMVRGSKWMSIPVEVKGKYFQKINETKVSKKGWQQSHLGMLKHNYAKAQCFKEIFPFIEELYLTCNYEYLTEINLHFIRGINFYLGITTPIKLSSEFQLHEEKTQRLVNICASLGAAQYFTGAAAKAYIDKERFTQGNIKVCYWDYSNYPEYEQLGSPFEHGVTIFDLLLCKGIETKNYMNFLS